MNLGFYKGFRQSNNYKYFIPLNVIAAPLTPTLYELVVDIKLGGKVEQLRQKFTLCNEATGGIAVQGPLWGLLNNSYVQQFGANFDQDSFTKSIGLILTGDISVDGVYQVGNNYVTVASNANLVTNLIATAGGSIFNYLPNITGIKLDGLTIPSQSLDDISNQNIDNIDLTGLTKLEKFSIQNCTGLTQDIDLTGCPDITQVDASGTYINVLVPENTKLTKYELGTPTSISIINPTVLQPSGVLVEAYKNLDSIDIINIPNTKSFSTFEKIMQNYNGTIMFGKGANNNGVIEDAQAVVWITTPIYIPAGTQITVQYTGNKSEGVFDYMYNSNMEFVGSAWHGGVNGTVTYTFSQYNNTTTYARFSGQQNWGTGGVPAGGASLLITNTSTGDIIFNSSVQP